MTDARLHPTFLTNHKVDDLDDAAFRVYVNGIVLTASQETDGRLTRRALRLLHPEPLDLLGIAARLVAAGLWEPRENGWHVHDFADYQTSKAQAEASREAARLRKAKSRAGKSQRDKQGSHSVTGGSVTPSDKGQDSDRTGQDRLKNKETPSEPNQWVVTGPVCESPHCTVSLGPSLTFEGKTMHDRCLQDLQDEKLKDTG